jgi:hypothetical protein
MALLMQLLLLRVGCAVLTSDGSKFAGKGCFPARSPLSKNEAKKLKANVAPHF